MLDEEGEDREELVLRELQGARTIDRSAVFVPVGAQTAQTWLRKVWRNLMASTRRKTLPPDSAVVCRSEKTFWEKN